jgi:hypothetical protein
VYFIEYYALDRTKGRPSKLVRRPPIALDVGVLEEFVGLAETFLVGKHALRRLGWERTLLRKGMLPVLKHHPVELVAAFLENVQGCVGAQKRSDGRLSIDKD